MPAVRYRTLLRPKWLAFHLAIALVVVVMVNLGLWQLRRLEQRKDFNAEVRARATVPVGPYEQVVPTGIDPASVQWRNVMASGTYLADEQVLQINRTQEGRPGSNVVTPLRLHDGRLLLVNRGFVADGVQAPAAPAGEVTVGGRVRTSQSRRFGDIADAAQGELADVRLIDIARLAPQLPGPVEPVYLERITSDPAEVDSIAPLPAPELVNGPHLSYAIQWSIFSVCAICGWVLVVRRALRSTGDGRRQVGHVAVADQPPAIDLDTDHLGDGGVEGPEVEQAGGGRLQDQA